MNLNFFKIVCFVLRILTKRPVLPMPRRVTFCECLRRPLVPNPSPGIRPFLSTRCPFSLPIPFPLPLSHRIVSLSKSYLLKRSEQKKINRMSDLKETQLHSLPPQPPPTAEAAAGAPTSGGSSSAGVPVATGGSLVSGTSPSLRRVIVLLQVLNKLELHSGRQ